jgi:signal peptidase I
MVPTLQINDRVMVNKLSMNFGDPGRGDIVVFRDPTQPAVEESIPEAVIRSVLEAIGVRTRGADDLIKRVIALPGETVSIQGNQVHVDGVPLSEPYLPADTENLDFAPVTVEEGHVFVMGDNRTASFDSRRFGPVPIDEIVGRAFVIIWPLSHFGSI